MKLKQPPKLRQYTVMLKPSQWETLTILTESSEARSRSQILRKILEKNLGENEK